MKFFIKLENTCLRFITSINTIILEFEFKDECMVMPLKVHRVEVLKGTCQL